MLKGNKGEWSEPYALLKLLADGKLFLGGENFKKIKGLFYPILKVIRHEKIRSVEFSYYNSLVIISNGKVLLKVPISDFVKNAKLCFDRIKKSNTKTGSFGIPEIEKFLTTISIKKLKAKSKLKNDITIQIVDSKTFISPLLGFSVKSQMGGPSTLVNASGVTNFTFILSENSLNKKDISKVNNTKKFSEKFRMLDELGVSLKFEKVEHRIFRSNLQTIDSNFDQILSELLILFYSNTLNENSVAKLVNKVSSMNKFEFDLETNSSMYELIMKKFLTDYALGMRASEVWKREYEATGGYLIVRDDGEIICYHFYFAKNFEDYIYKNTKFEAGSPSKHHFGKIYLQDGFLKIKLNLQVRFTK